MHWFHRHIGLAAVGLLTATTAATAQQDHIPNQIDFATFLDSPVHDSPECDVKIVGGKITFGDSITNPAMSCPDAFAWSLFAQVTTQAWWENWSTDREVWPSDPWPRCSSGETKSCCPSVTISNDVWPEHCPVYPGDTPGVPKFVAGTPFQIGEFRATVLAFRDHIGGGLEKWSDVPDVLKNAVIGSVQNELVYRNEPMVDYIFSRDLYYTEGLARVYANFVKAISAYAPRRPAVDNPLAANPTTPGLYEIDFPISSIMLKINWLEVDQAKNYGIDPLDAQNPYIIMNLVPQADTNTAPKTAVATKPFILLSMHISTKDVPNWFWATFEHVDNQGRCDWVGCNDSFGYVDTETPAVDPTLAAGLAPPTTNLTPPHGVTKVDQASQDAFKIAGIYSNVDRISDKLDAIFKAFGIATDVGANDSGEPSQKDQAWRSYRLKGTQTNFVDSTGRRTRLGNSVTEAGFVNSASCITCHARAGATDAGLPPLSIFEDTLSDAGIPRSSNGDPNEAWFNVNGYWGVQGEREAPDIRAIQTDFVWGFRNACPMKPSVIAPAWCANRTAAK